MQVSLGDSHARLPGETIRVSQAVRPIRRILRGPARMWRGSMRAWQGLQAKVRPVEDIPCPIIETPLPDDLPSVIALDPRFQDTVRWFAQDPTRGRSLLSPDAQAFLFAMVRNLKPEHAFEIGTFRAGTSEAIARAIHTNGAGTIHTVDPFGMPQVPAILAKWPRELRRCVRFYPVDSMAFHMEATRLHLTSGLTLIDGHHDYEFVAFDLNAACRSIAPGGFVILDNFSQPGPFLAVQDFCASTLGWRHCGAQGRVRPLRPFDRSSPHCHS
jgi:methyltransferase family protein